MSALSNLGDRLSAIAADISRLHQEYHELRRLSEPLQPHTAYDPVSVRLNGVDLTLDATDPAIRELAGASCNAVSDQLYMLWQQASLVGMQGFEIISQAFGQRDVPVQAGREAGSPHRYVDYVDSPPGDPNGPPGAIGLPGLPGVPASPPPAFADPTGPAYGDDMPGLDLAEDEAADLTRPRDADLNHRHRGGRQRVQ